MSAWYIFGVMGFYPVTPANETFAIGAPQFPEFTLRLLKDGTPKSFKIIANNLSEDNMYIQSLKLDGKVLEEPFITYTQIMNGKVLEFEMGSSPNYTAFKDN
jgi:putative alpha-1,2-mannosidase